jgi:hypothetical protein
MTSGQCLHNSSITEALGSRLLPGSGSKSGKAGKFAVLRPAAADKHMYSMRSVASAWQQTFEKSSHFDMCKDMDTPQRTFVRAKMHMHMSCIYICMHLDMCIYLHVHVLAI